MARILLIDDEVSICRVVRRIIEADAIPHQVLMAHEGKDGLRLAAKEKPDLILLDVNMPGMDGLTVLEKLGADRKTKFIPVIMLTGDDTLETKQEALQGFADQYLIKPVSREKLMAAVNRVLGVGAEPGPEDASAP
jgi:DNA-binding response OmpR family regulator